ncbi:MAG: Crp/Fnr family transcriptional regulator [Bacteroidaceae bacterium]|nr:Crp/Fnr family transcriptional regulator [Bacteroidaceae bacterium]
MEISMFERMQSLPLLQGLTMQEFSDLIMNLKLDFQQWEEGDLIVGQGDRCNNLIYVIDGTFESELHDETTALILSEVCTSVPHLIEPYNLFGVKRSYERSYVFKSSGSTFSISREFFMQRMLHNNIVRSNYINFLCNNLRKANALRTAVPHENIEEKIKSVIASFCLCSNGEKNVRVKMSDLADLVDETRLNVSSVLNKWNDQGLIELRRYGFRIKDFDRL